ncbi:MAG: hypothetical protein FWE12_03725 [Oscillospiraceae bacterium]|nr:hypothetical protein [Oscillospiraceae bacterium]
MRVLIRGGGEVATGIAIRLRRARFEVIITELADPVPDRPEVSFAMAVREGIVTMEGVEAVYTESINLVESAILAEGHVAVLVDPDLSSVPLLKPDVVVDSILVGKNFGTTMTLAPLVIAVGAGFTAGVDCHAVVDAERGHDLGRVLLAGSGAPPTGATPPQGDLRCDSVSDRALSVAGGVLEAILRLYPGPITLK